MCTHFHHIHLCTSSTVCSRIPSYTLPCNSDATHSRQTARTSVIKHQNRRHWSLLENRCLCRPAAASSCCCRPAAALRLPSATSCAEGLCMIGCGISHSASLWISVVLGMGTEGSIGPSTGPFGCLSALLEARFEHQEPPGGPQDRLGTHPERCYCKPDSICYTATRTSWTL